MKYPVPKVSIAFRDSKKRVLLVKRAGAWELPNGTLRGGCFWTDFMFERTLEVVGLKIDEHKLLGIYSDPKLNVSQGEHYLNVCFVVSRWSGKIILGEGIEEYHWFDVSSLPSQISPLHLKPIQNAYQCSENVFVS